MKIPVGKIPKYITASSPKGLQRLMLRTHALLGYGVNWFDIKQTNKKKWIAWYLDNDDISLHNVEDKLGDD